MIRLATVSPCYNEEEVLRHSVERLTALFERMISEGLITPDSMMVFVNDGSRDRTWQIIRELHAENKFVKGINMSRNVGHQNAIMAGMMTAREWADAVVTIDADLQDDIECIPQMVRHFEAGNDIVYGVKVSREADPFMKKFTAQAFYKLQSSMGVESVYNHADFRLMSRRALDMLATYPEHNLYLRGLIPLIGLPHTTIDDVISERFAGQSKYTLRALCRPVEIHTGKDAAPCPQRHHGLLRQTPLLDLQPRRTLPHHCLLYRHLCRTGVDHRHGRSGLVFTHPQHLAGGRLCPHLPRHRGHLSRSDLHRGQAQAPLPCGRDLRLKTKKNRKMLSFNIILESDNVIYEKSSYLCIYKLH